MKKLSFSILAVLILVGSFVFSVPDVLATTGGGTATIGVDGGGQGANVTVVQSTSHTFTTILTIPGAGMTLGASSPTFTIPTGFTIPTTNAVANPGLVNADGKWSVVASGGGCAVTPSTSVASGQVITVDITADCAAGNTITLTYQGTSATSMGATALVVSTADAGDTSPVTPLIAGSPTITVTATATPTPTPTAAPTSTPTSAPAATSAAASLALSSSGGPNSTFCPALNNIATPLILTFRRVSPTSIFLSWGPFSGVNTFNVQYGFTDGNWLFNTDVTGFSTTLNSLPANQPIWVRVAARSDCRIGDYGQSKLIGGPGLPSTGFDPDKTTIQWLLTAVILIEISVLLFIVKKYKVKHVTF